MTKAVSLAVVTASIAALASKPALREWVVKASGYNAPGGIWRILAIVFALGNLKNLPFVWHVCLAFPAFISIPRVRGFVEMNLC